MAHDQKNSATSVEPRRSKKKWAVAATIAFLVLAGSGAAIGTHYYGQTQAADSEAQSFTGSTEKIAKGTLSGETSLTATLRYSNSHGVASGFDGVVTSLPKPGDIIGQGQELAEVGDEPSYLMHGSVPAWRELNIDSTNGEDIHQLETALKELGFFEDEPDNCFDWVTRKAVVAWQKANGLRQTGTIPLGRIVFEPHDLRVGQLSVRPGDRTSVGAELYKATATTQTVEAEIPLANQSLATIGREVSLHLPDGTTTTGKIATVGTPTDKKSSESSDQKTRIIPVTITPDDPEKTSAFQEASITIGLPSESKENVLHVPVSALIALDSKTFGVEIVNPDGTTKKVPVTTGLFAAGRVEISGEGIAEGDSVVVPKQ